FHVAGVQTCALPISLSSVDQISPRASVARRFERRAGTIGARTASRIANNDRFEPISIYVERIIVMKKAVFMGTPDFAVPILEALIHSDIVNVVLVVTQPDRPVGRKRVLTAPPVKKAALKHGILVFQPEKLKDEYEEILKYEPDI